MPWPCSEFTITSGPPAQVSNKLPGASAMGWLGAYCASNGTPLGSRWSIRPCTSCTRWCSVPPSATLISWKPRHTPNSGTPCATQALTSASVSASRAGSSGRLGSSTASSKWVGWTLEGEPVSITPSTKESSSSICSGSASGNITGCACAPTLTARAYLSPSIRKGIWWPWSPSSRWSAGSQTMQGVDWFMGSPLGSLHCGNQIGSQSGPFGARLGCHLRRALSCGAPILWPGGFGDGPSCVC